MWYRCLWHSTLVFDSGCNNFSFSTVFHFSALTFYDWHDTVSKKQEKTEKVLSRVRQNLINMWGILSFFFITEIWVEFVASVIVPQTGSKILWNVGKILPEYTASYHRNRHSLHFSSPKTANFTNFNLLALEIYI